jgi:hypothetical protein
MDQYWKIENIEPEKMKTIYPDEVIPKESRKYNDHRNI